MILEFNRNKTYLSNNLANDEIHAISFMSHGHKSEKAFEVLLA